MKTHVDRRLVARASLHLAAMAVLGACSENVAPTPKPLGTISVATTTSGGDPDDDGYKIIVDGKRSVSVGIDRVAFLDSMSVGPHVVALEGIANNCNPVKPRSVDVRADETLTVSFDVRCEATGVQITTQTTGPDYGPFDVKVGERTGFIAANGTLSITRLAPGAQIISLGVSNFCQSLDTPTNVLVNNRQITRVTIRIRCSASDKVLAFVRDDSRGGFIVVSKVDGTAGDTLVKGHAPSWAPDGGKIMYSTAECLSYGYYGDDVQCTGGLFILNPDSRVTNAVPGGQNGEDPAWSPDGQSIVFRKTESFREKSKLYLLKLNGSSIPVELSTPTNDSKHPAWSPDGKRIVFQCLMSGSDGFTHNEICLINADGTGFTQLTHDELLNLRPAWSPDGKTIAFSAYLFVPLVSDSHQIVTMSADGSNISRIASGDSPAWSPDGSKLLFNRADGLFVSNPDGSGVVRITTGLHRYAAWRPPVDDSCAGCWDY